MDQKTEIKNWFESGMDYQAGIGLYVKYGKNRSLIRFFQQNDSKARVDKLKWELCKIAGLPENIYHQSKNTPIVQIAENNSVRVEKPQTTLNKRNGDYPKEIQELHKEKGNLFSRRDILHSELSKIPDDNNNVNVNQRAEFLKEIDASSVRIEEITKLIREWKKSGQVKKKEAPKAKEPSKPKTEAEMIKRVNNLRTYKTKTEKEIRNLPEGSPKRENKAKKLNDIIAELQELEKNLGK